MRTKRKQSQENFYLTQFLTGHGYFYKYGNNTDEKVKERRNVSETA